VVEPGSSDFTPLVLRLEDRLEPRRIGVAWARDRTRTRAAEAFVETARAVALERFSQ
jgi:DNA-binding transcriptional LysR family regulator